MNEAVLLSNLVPMAIALGGWILTFIVAERSWRRGLKQNEKTRSLEFKIGRLNQQIGDLYGPVNAKLIAGREAWGMFWQLYQPSHGLPAYFVEGTPNTDEENARWRLWVTSVFQPNNREVAAIIQANAHLIELEDKSGSYPEPFAHLFAHTKAYDGIIAQWESGDFIRHETTLDFPNNLQDYVAQKLKKLIMERDHLLQLSGTESTT